jgi:hypothetical protein
MTSTIESLFAQSYAEARRKFLAAATAAALPVQSHLHPYPGRDGEELAMDVARAGPADAQRLLIITSGCHGVEGYCGSGVQGALLADAGFAAAAQASGIALLYVHALNPYGFSWLRRVTHENVDLNRNGHDYDSLAELPHNPAYDAIAAAVIPPTWPPSAANEAVLARYAAEHGAMGLQAAVSGGQYSHPNGLFYGGAAPTWSARTFEAVLAEHASSAGHIGWIDVHTGLGPNGHGEKIWGGRDDDAAGIARARRWWGADVTSTGDGSSSSAPLQGLLGERVRRCLPQAEITSIALEYGTEPIDVMIGALRAECWLHNHPEADADTHARIKRAFRDAFYTDTPAWKARIVEQAQVAARQALVGLS